MKNVKILTRVVLTFCQILLSKNIFQCFRLCGLLFETKTVFYVTRQAFTGGGTSTIVFSLCLFQPFQIRYYNVGIKKVYNILLSDGQQWLVYIFICKNNSKQKQRKTIRQNDKRQQLIFCCVTVKQVCEMRINRDLPPIGQIVKFRAANTKPTDTQYTAVHSRALRRRLQLFCSSVGQFNQLAEHQGFLKCCVKI